MMLHPTTRFKDVYEDLLFKLSRSRIEETNIRTGKTVRMLRGGTSFSLDLANGMLPVPGNRKVFPATAAAEVAWFLQGTQDPAFIMQYAPIWDKFVEDSTQIGSLLGEERPCKVVKAAYGYRWRQHFGRDQVRLAVEALRRNPSDRRVWVQAWDPSEDGLGAPGQVNVPCPVGFTLSVVDEELHSSLFIRSSDVFVGLPYDVMGHALLMDAFAKSLGGVGPGTMHVTLAHPHIYDVHFDMVEESLKGKQSSHSMEMPCWSLEQIEEDPHGYVASVKEEAKIIRQPEYSCKPEVVQ